MLYIEGGIVQTHRPLKKVADEVPREENAGRYRSGGDSELLISLIPLSALYLRYKLQMTDAFSTAAEHIFEHPELQDVQAIAGPSSNGDASGDSVEEAFEVGDTIRRIIEGGYKTVRVLLRLGCCSPA